MPSEPTLTAIFERARQVRLLALDVDGVLTDGQLYFGNTGEELKSFSTLDGQGIKLLQDNGIAVALITARTSALVERRARNLGIRHLVQGSDNKLAALEILQGELQIDMASTAYVGDDLPDLACIRRAGLGICVPNGHFAVKEQAFCTTTQPGGAGAVRQVCDWILQAQGLFDAAISGYY